MNSLEEFSAWREDVRRRLERDGFKVTFFDAPHSANPGKRLDFRADDVEATIAVWERGDPAVEVFLIDREVFLEIEDKAGLEVGLTERLNGYVQQILDARAKR